jgi:hypothetical protein
MRELRTTNWLLLGILLALLAHPALRMGAGEVLAETFQLDACITQKPNEKPASYLHVVTHDFSGR